MANLLIKRTKKALFMKPTLKGKYTDLELYMKAIDSKAELSTILNWDLRHQEMIDLKKNYAK